jgi:hypothetical protein
MSRLSLEGLNIVYPPVDSSQANFDLSNPINIPELDAQLDLWTNLAFQSDEPIIPRPLTPTGDEKDPQSFQMQHAQPSQDLSLNNYNFFNQFSIDPFLVPPTAASLPPAAPMDSPSSPTSDSYPIDKQSNKRPRTATKKPVINEPGSPDSNGATVSAAEDKRRRNTAASDRFRAKKKERDAALEKKSKELETRVSELERECESLRRENGWLKGLVVGVTGASAGAASTNSGVAVVSHATKRRRSIDEEKPSITASNDN